MGNNMKYIVYITVNSVNNKIYIGVHKTDSDKFDGYIGNGVNKFNPSTIKYPKTNFQQAVKKYGFDAFTRYTIAEFSAEEDALNLESILVNNNFINRSDTYNMIDGGGVIIRSMIPIYQFAIDGTLIKKYPSIKQAAIETNDYDSNIIIAYKSKKSHNNYFWSISDTINIKDYKLVSQNKIIYQYNLKGELINSYESLSKAGLDNDCSPEQIKNSINKLNPLNKKYYSYNDRLILGFNLNNIIYRYSIDGNLLDHNTIGNYCKIYGLDARKLHKASNSGLTLNKYQWNINNPIKMSDLTSRIGSGVKKRVGQYDLEGNLIKIFNTVTECKKEFTNVRKVLNGQLSNTKGYVFKYIDNIKDIV